MSNLTPAVLLRALNRLGALKFAPREPEALAVIGEILQAECKDEASLEKSVKHILAEFDEYPGPRTLRRIVSDLLHVELEYRHEWEDRPINNEPIVLGPRLERLQTEYNLRKSLTAA